MTKIDLDEPIITPDHMLKAVAMVKRDLSGIRDTFFPNFDDLLIKFFEALLDDNNFTA